MQPAPRSRSPFLDPHEELEHRQYSHFLIDDLLRGNDGAKKVRVPAPEVNRSYGTTCNVIPGRVSWGSGKRDDIPVVRMVVCAQCKGSCWNSAPEGGREKTYQAQ